MSEECDNCGKTAKKVETHFVTREEKWCPKCVKNDGEYED